MNRDEAKYILRSYHLGGRDAEDPQFRDALEMLKHDPELVAWFAQEQAIDQKLSEAFRRFPAPPDLRGQLLAARKVVPRRAWWQRPAWVSAAAACAAVLGALVILLTHSSKERQFAEFRAYIADTAAKLDHLDFQTKDLIQIRQWLASHSAPENFVIPGKLKGTSSLGCRVFAWNEKKVSLVCFQVPNNRVAHLFVMDRSALADLPREGVPQFHTTGDGIALASWTEGQRIYIVAMTQGEQYLRGLLL